MRTISITSNHIAVFLKSFHYIDFLFLTNVPGLYFISFLSQGSWPKNACPFAEINVKINNVDLSITNSRYDTIGEMRKATTKTVDVKCFLER